MKRILVTGSRDWDDHEAIRYAIEAEMPPLPGALGDRHLTLPPVVVHGGARGADEAAGRVAIWLRIGEEVHRADWFKYGKRAGFVRNKQMVDAGADVCLAFIRNNSKGATMCARLAEQAGIPVKYIRIDDSQISAGPVRIDDAA